MQYYISQSARIYLSTIITLLYISSLHAQQSPYHPMPNASDQSVSVSITQAPASSMSRSASHGHFQESKKNKKNKHKKNQTMHGSAQRHDESAHTINGYSINVAASMAHARTCNNKLAVSVSLLMLAGLSAVTYLQVRIIDQAEQIGANTASLDVIGNQLAKTAEQIVGGVNTLNDILGLLFNLTRKG